MTERLFNFANQVVGHIKGGLGQVNILASIIFSGMSGAAVADAAGLGAIEIKAMKEQGYSPQFAAAITAASSVIGPIIPPSIPMVIYAMIAEQSVGRMFLGGVIPGLLLGFILMAMTYFMAASGREECPTGNPFSLKESLLSFRRAFLSLLAPILILGALFLGIGTPTEIGAVAVLYSLFLGFLYKDLTLRNLMEAVEDSVKGTAVILFIISVASIFGFLLATERIPHLLTQGLLSITHNPTILLLLINAGLLFLGCFIEGMALLAIFVPSLLPIVKAVGIDPVHFGITIVLNITLAILTPPVGVALYVVSDTAKIKFEEVCSAIWPYTLALFVGLILLIVFPQIVLWLPSMLLD